MGGSPPLFSNADDESIEKLAANLAAKIRPLLRDSVPTLLTIQEAAERLRCHPNTIRALIEDGDLICTRVTPRAPRIDAAQLARFVRARTGA